MMTHLDPKALGTVSGPALARPQRPASSQGAFASLLHQSLQPLPVKFSAHARQRLDSRGVAFAPGELEQIAKAVDEVAAKGGRESLVMTDRAALVVNVSKRTVITVLSPNSEENTVVTNIDSAVVAPVRPSPETEVPITKNWPAPERGGLGAAERLTRHHTLEV